MTPDTAISQPTRNRFDRMEVAGAFGDLGTLIPFVVRSSNLLLSRGAKMPPNARGNRCEAGDEEAGPQHQ